ncbi:hypothetical protein [Desulfitibacter alkalitolerans]|uniref:hypothetical protein n=1 Tax=Desulfitibacter alkalitolerans TaxID=264641 RepID=UPI000481C885|nr:hypothetical protein [Desulfitibacter alkalitolerans]
MIVYIYDGTFSGLLTAVYEAFYQKEKPGQILKEWDYSQNQNWIIHDIKRKTAIVYNLPSR